MDTRHPRGLFASGQGQMRPFPIMTSPRLDEFTATSARRTGGRGGRVSLEGSGTCPGAKIEHTEDWQQVELLCGWPERVAVERGEFEEPIPAQFEDRPRTRHQRRRMPEAA